MSILYPVVLLFVGSFGDVDAINRKKGKMEKFNFIGFWSGIKICAVALTFNKCLCWLLI